MILRLLVANAQGVTQGECFVKLDFTTKQWSVPGPPQRVGKRDAVDQLSDDSRSTEIWTKFSFSTQGSFEVRDNGVIWIWDQEPGKGKRNTVIIRDAPQNESDAAHASGIARLYEPKSPAFKDAEFPWSSGEPLLLDTVHFYAAKANWGFKTQMQECAEGAANASDLLVPLTDINAFREFLTNARRKHQQIRRAYFWAHGDAGGIQMGSSPVALSDWDQFEGHGWDGVFAPNAIVIFNGCKLAASAEGEAFLARFASIFLRRGGTVEGAKGYVLNHPFLGFTVVLASPCAGWARAEVGPTGSVKLRNGGYLNASSIISRMEAQQKIHCIARRPNTKPPDITDPEVVIPKKLAWLKKDYGSGERKDFYDVDQGPPSSGRADWYLELLRESKYLDRLEGN